MDEINNVNFYAALRCNIVIFYLSLFYNILESVELLNSIYFLYRPDYRVHI